MLTIEYCPACEKNIEELGEFIEIFMEEVIYRFVGMEGPLEVDTKRYPNFIKFLEDRKFILTMECGPSEIAIRPLGCNYHETSNGYYCQVCFDRKTHG